MYNENVNEIKDIHIQTMKLPTYEQMKKINWNKPEKKQFIIYGDGPNSHDTNVEIELDNEMTIEELKSVILKETKGQPFFFKFLLNNN